MKRTRDDFEGIAEAMDASDEGSVGVDDPGPVNMVVEVEGTHTPPTYVSPNMRNLAHAFWARNPSAYVMVSSDRRRGLVATRVNLMQALPSMCGIGDAFDPQQVLRHAAHVVGLSEAEMDDAHSLHTPKDLVSTGRPMIFVPPVGMMADGHFWIGLGALIRACRFRPNLQFVMHETSHVQRAVATNLPFSDAIGNDGMWLTLMLQCACTSLVDMLGHAEAVRVSIDGTGLMMQAVPIEKNANTAVIYPRVPDFGIEACEAVLLRHALVNVVAGLTTNAPKVKMDENQMTSLSLAAQCGLGSGGSDPGGKSPIIGPCRMETGLFVRVPATFVMGDAEVCDEEMSYVISPNAPGHDAIRFTREQVVRQGSIFPLGRHVPTPSISQIIVTNRSRMITRDIKGHGSSEAVNYDDKAKAKRLPVMVQLPFLAEFVDPAARRSILGKGGRVSSHDFACGMAERWGVPVFALDPGDKTRRYVGMSYATAFRAIYEGGVRECRVNIARGGEERNYVNCAPFMHEILVDGPRKLCVDVDVDLSKAPHLKQESAWHAFVRSVMDAFMYAHYQVFQGSDNCTNVDFLRELFNKPGWIVFDHSHDVGTGKRSAHLINPGIVYKTAADQQQVHQAMLFAFQKGGRIAKVFDTRDIRLRRDGPVDMGMSHIDGAIYQARKSFRVPYTKSRNPAPMRPGMMAPCIDLCSPTIRDAITYTTMYGSRIEEYRAFFLGCVRCVRGVTNDDVINGLREVRFHKAVSVPRDRPKDDTQTIVVDSTVFPELRELHRSGPERDMFADFLCNMKKANVWDQALLRNGSLTYKFSDNPENCALKLELPRERGSAGSSSMRCLVKDKVSGGRGGYHRNAPVYFYVRLFDNVLRIYQGCYKCRSAGTGNVCLGIIPHQIFRQIMFASQ